MFIAKAMMLISMDNFLFMRWTAFLLLFKYNSNGVKKYEFSYSNYGDIKILLCNHLARLNIKLCQVPKVSFELTNC
jgi:hypothetical protein